MRDLERAKQALIEDEYTCVLCQGDTLYTSRQRGVKPLMAFLQANTDVSGFCAADKTVGAGAAHLYVLLGVRAVWAQVVSERGWQVLEQNGIPIMAAQRVPYIINRRGDGMCPIEQAVGEIADSREAYAVICRTLAALADV